MGRLGGVWFHQKAHKHGMASSGASLDTVFELVRRKTLRKLRCSVWDEQRANGAGSIDSQLRNLSVVH